MAKDPKDLLHGTLDVLILKSLTLGPAHGYAVSRWIEERTAGVLTIEDAALYKSLHRLEAAGAVDSDWGLSDSNRRAKYYQLTRRGRELLRTETAVWNRYAEAVAAVLAPGKA
ncbi:MAG: PadR family transcriptional regulator [Gemmatimonadales bacterium]